MSRGGSRPGAGRKSLSTEERRKQLSCRVKAETFQWLTDEKERVNRSIGDLVDLAIETLKEHPEKQFSEPQE